MLWEDFWLIILSQISEKNQNSHGSPYVLGSSTIVIIIVRYSLLTPGYILRHQRISWGAGDNRSGDRDDFQSTVKILLLSSLFTIVITTSTTLIIMGKGCYVRGKLPNFQNLDDPQKNTYLRLWEKRPFGSFELKEMRNLYISVKKSCLIRAAIQGNPEKKSYSVKGKENLQDQKCVNQKGSVRSTCCHGQIENGKYFRGKKEIPSNLRSESLFCKKIIGWWDPHNGFQKISCCRTNNQLF